MGKKEDILRDEFASSALSGLLASRWMQEKLNAPNPPTAEQLSHLAAIAYGLADAMLLERESAKQRPRD